MSADPTFATREELIAWVERKIVGANKLKPTAQMELLREIRRVTNANPFPEEAA